MKKNIKRFIIFTIIFTLLCAFSLTFSQDIEKSSKFYAYKLMERGIFHFNLNQYEAAIDYFTQTLKVYPSLFPAREWRAKSFYRKGQIENAREEYKRLVSIHPDDIRLQNRLDEIDFILSHPETF
ncbi:MAG: tetratricopeptide repeat protein, partial [Spirochaetota bacterium]